jgi:hypothetical protein
MVYTSGVIRDTEREETLEELQDNKLTLVCEKLDLQPTDKLLDIGCGWGTLVAFAAKNYGCTATGVTLARNQTEFGNRRAAENGVADRAKIECMDFRQVPNTYGKKAFTKIVSLEMAEVRTRTYGRECCELTSKTARWDPSVPVVPGSGVRPPRRRWHLRLPGCRLPALVAVRGPHLVPLARLVDASDPADTAAGACS